VRSLNPFYTQDKIKYEPALLGEWTTKTSKWKFQSFKKLWLEDKKKDKQISLEDKQIFELYKDSYIVEYQKTSSSNKIEDMGFSNFVVTPFKVNDDILLNFYPLEYETESLDNLVAQHILNTNSVCLVEFLEKGTIKLKWLDEDVINRLIDEEKLKIKHEKIGIDQGDLILTASSEELYRFLEKFLKSDTENKWEQDQTYTLNKIDVRD
jgi:hypothetical protein